MLQMNGAAPDFYPIPSTAFANYRRVDLPVVRAKNPKLIRGLETIEGLADLLNSGDARIIGGLKTKPVAMVKMSDLGYLISEAAEIDAPWGGTQTKPAGQDAYIVIASDGNSAAITRFMNI